MTITNQQLRDKFLNAQMQYYFEKKLAPLAPQEVTARIEELLKFLNMAVYCEGNIPVSKEIDEAWHYWILETKEYKKLCSALQGREFLHHSSNDYLEYRDPNVIANSNDLGRDVAMLATYVLNYGPFDVDRVKYWPFAAHLLCNYGWSIDQLNHWLSPAPGRRPARPHEFVGVTEVKRTA